MKKSLLLFVASLALTVSAQTPTPPSTPPAPAAGES